MRKKLSEFFAQNSAMYNLLLGILFFFVYNVTAEEDCLTSSGKTGICGIEGSDPKIEETDVFPENTPSNFILNPVDVSNHPNLGLLDRLTCGAFSEDKMMTQSNKTGVFDFPWMALIMYQVTGHEYPVFLCGGTIINKRYILTAAHCVTALPSNLTIIGVRVGEHDVYNPIDCNSPENEEQRKCTEGFQEFNIESTHFHPQFSVNKMHNDIALIRLNRDIDFEPENVKPICLPIGNAARLYGKKAILTGWGTTKFGLRSPDRLQVMIPLVSNEDCAKIYNQETLFVGQMCAGGETGKDSCIRDDGGPLQKPGNYDNKLKYVQYGIFSYGLSKCGIRGYPGIYTAVSHYVDWILNTIRE